jgi:hypothetical protein
MFSETCIYLQVHTVTTTIGIVLRLEAYLIISTGGEVRMWKEMVVAHFKPQLSI